MPDKGASDAKSLQFSAVYEGMDATFRDAVVSRALSFRGQASAGAANALNSAIQRSRVRVTGYRDAVRAPHTLLRAPVSQLITSDADLAGTVLRVWAESQQALEDKVVKHLDSADIGAEYPNFSAKQFRGTWSPNDWKAHRNAFMRSHEDEGFSDDEAALMICYVAGRVPGMRDRNSAGVVAESSKQRFQEFLDFLKGLPAGAPEWEEAVPEFLDSFSALIAAKEAEMKWADDFDAVLQSIGSEFDEMLAFFENDTDQWSSRRVSRTADASSALGLVGELKSSLAEYGPIHDRAPSISEERERAQLREKLQPRILDIIEQIDQLMTDESDVAVLDDSGRNAGSREGTTSYEPDELMQGTNLSTAQEPPPSNSLQEALTAAESPHGEHPAPTLMHPDAAAEVEGLKSEVERLLENVCALNSQVQSLKDHNEALETELQDSQRLEESWRIAYRSAKGGSVEVEAEDGPEIESVNDAVELAKSRYRQELVFAPNSQSSVEGNPFTDPQRVWGAFRWLATTYYASKMGRLRVTDFDQSIKEACGWWYKGDQGETTLSRYEKSYTTRVDGKRHWLAEHIGKGTSFDARYTIRIAFEWDRDLRQVIVGYIGRHQQTDAS